ncbi:CUE domain-containing protein 2-A-like isoform X2 [Ornithodoros turicata]
MQGGLAGKAMNSGDGIASDLFVKNSLVHFVQQETNEGAIDMIDDILLAYVVGILQTESTEEGFDVLEFKEMLSAYIPGFDSISDAKVSAWVRLLSKEVLTQCKGKCPVDNSASQGSHVPPKSPVEPKPPKALSRSRNTSQSEEEPKKPNRIAVCDESSLADERTIRVLCEMFPHLCSTEVRRCLIVAGGDSEAATQILLQRESLGPTPSVPHVPRRDNGNALGEKELRAQILTRYGYIDQDEDGKEHRPVAPKTEPKKLIRYRDNKIVSVKGEKYSEVKSEESDDMKRTYVTLKPARQ